MASSLPSESASDKSVQTFGLGTYDDFSFPYEKGENSNEKSTKRTTPDGGGSGAPDDGSPDNPDNRLLGYPQTFATAELPGDFDKPPSGALRQRDVIVNRVPSVSQTALPSGGARPVVDYADRMTISYNGDEWADEDSGAYASESLPSPGDGTMSRENSLGALGNAWSGYNVQDQAVPSGFPSEDYLTDYTKFNHMNASELKMRKTATNVTLVRSITSGFLKEFGKKNLTRRHVMAFLQKTGSHQYLASDVIRCLLLDHNIYVKDVLDEFPVHKAASSGHNIASLISARGHLIDLEIKNISNPSVSSIYRHAAAALTRSIASLERNGNG